MPFPMTHLCVAKAIVDLGGISRPEQFMLGAVAPDAVHERPGFTAHDKYVSHLCVGEYPWGEIQDNAAWRDSVARFWQEHGKGARRDFFRGYCAHILTDVAWNEQFYQRLRAAHPEEFVGRWSSPFHKACSDVDVRLYEADGKEAIWSLLREAQPVAVPGRVSREEVQAECRTLLGKYQKEPLTGVVVRSEVTLGSVQAFIAREAARINSLLQ